MSLRMHCQELIQQSPPSNYAHEYDNYLNFFRILGHAQAPVECVDPPSCWCPFILWLGHQIVRSAAPAGTVPVSATQRNWDCDVTDWAHLYRVMEDKRRAVEISSTCRPELVHALYLADTEWPCPLRHHHEEKGFVVTCNGSFFRDEIHTYHTHLHSFEPTRRRAVIVPCAAAKPYPAPLHQSVLDILSGVGHDEWHVIVATGVLGLVPQELWGVMPHYDSGLPNLQRCTETACWYFVKHRYELLVVYSDFYAHALNRGLKESMYKGPVAWLFGNHYRDSYENLLLPDHLRRLEAVICDGNQELERQQEEALNKYEDDDDDNA